MTEINPRFSPEKINKDTRELWDDVAKAALADVQRLGSKRGVAEAALNRIEDEETLADPQLQESVRKEEAGELTDITPED